MFVVSLTLWLIVNIQCTCDLDVPRHCYFCCYYRKSVRFVDAVAKLQACKKAQGLTLQSFLVLPMQRITRLPLLVNVSTYCCEMYVSLKICLQFTLDLCRSLKPRLQHANYGRTSYLLQQLSFKVRLGTKRVRKWLKMRNAVLLFSRVVPLLEFTIVQEGIVERVFLLSFYRLFVIAVSLVVTSTVKRTEP